MNLRTAEAVLHDLAEARQLHGDASCVSERALPHRRPVIAKALRIVYPTVADVPALREFYEALYMDLARYVPANRARKVNRLAKSDGRLSTHAVVTYSPSRRRRALSNLQQLDEAEQERVAERKRLEQEITELRQECLGR